jgi:uncharacterized membrane protein
MMGPVEFMVLTFPGLSPGDGAIRALAGLRLSGAVRVIDTLLVTKSDDGAVMTRELSEIPEFAYVAQPDQANLIAADDAEEVGETLPPGSCALLALVEQMWAAEAAEAVRASGGELAASVRIPQQVVREAIAAMEAS